MLFSTVTGHVGSQGAAPTAGGDALQSVPIWAGALLLFVLVFAFLAVRKAVRESARLRQPRHAAAEESGHFMAVPDLGTTMADGGDRRDDERS
jgi:hypothetical protein